MEISEAYARELEKQKMRKESLRSECEKDFGEAERILFEAGCGHGHWLTSYAEHNPNQICVGIDLINWRIRKGLEKKDKRALDNLYFYKAELNEFLEILPARIKFDLTVLLFPDPWPKARHHRRRMVQTALLDTIAARTDIGGMFCFRSDDRPYYDWTVDLLEAHPNWKIEANALWPHEMGTYFQSLMSEYFSVVALRV